MSARIVTLYQANGRTHHSKVCATRRSELTHTYQMTYAEAGKRFAVFEFCIVCFTSDEGELTRSSLEAEAALAKDDLRGPVQKGEAYLRMKQLRYPAMVGMHPEEAERIAARMDLYTEMLPETPVIETGQGLYWVAFDSDRSSRNTPSMVAWVESVGRQLRSLQPGARLVVSRTSEVPLGAALLDEVRDGDSSAVQEVAQALINDLPSGWTEQTEPAKYRELLEMARRTVGEG